MSDRKHHSDYSDDGEISDASSNRRGDRRAHSEDVEDEPMPSPEARPRKSITSDSEGDGPGKEVEDEMRSHLLNKMKAHKKYIPSSENDEDEMFSIQPKDAIKAKDKIKEAEREREREAERRKRQREREQKDREREKKEASERDRNRRDDRDRRPKDRKVDERRADDRHHKNREVRRPAPTRKDTRERSPDRPEKHKKREEKKEHKHKRRTSSSDSDEGPQRKPKEAKREKKEVKEELVEIEIEQVEVEVKVEVETEEQPISSFTLDSPAGPKKYSKFDSSPEKSPTPMRDVSKSPGPSDEYSEVEDNDELLVNDEEDVVDEVEVDETDVKWEDLTDEQKSFMDPEQRKTLETEYQARLVADLPVFYPGIMGCRNVAEFECVHRIDEGTYGVVYRAKDKRTDKVVALKRLKMEKEKEGFPITALREVNMLLKCGQHPNIVNVSEILIGSNMDKIFLAMEFVEHDMKKYMESMKKFHKKFTMGEVKTLMRQLLSGIEHMHKLWILHRDLKTSNLLISDNGILKIADFGLAREYGEPLKRFTPIVVTLWYRSPELLLGAERYSKPVDIWSVGCIMGEFFTLKPIFDGRGEADQLKKIYFTLGTPTEKIWEGVTKMKYFSTYSVGDYPYNQLRKMFPAHVLNEEGFQLLNSLLTYNPDNRISATEALADPWFTTEPLPVPPEELSTFPSKRPKKVVNTDILNPETAALMKELKVRPEHLKPSGFSLKF